MKKRKRQGPSRWNRFNWNPLFPGLILMLWLMPLAQSGWKWGEFSGLSWFGLVWLSLWFALACTNLFTGGKLVDRLYPNDDSDS